MTANFKPFIAWQRKSREHGIPTASEPIRALLERAQRSPSTSKNAEGPEAFWTQAQPEPTG